MHRSVSLSMHLSRLFISLCIHPFVDISIYISIYLSIYLSIYASRYLLVYRSVYLSIYRFMYLSNYSFIYLSIYLSIYLRIYVPVSINVYIYVSMYDAKQIKLKQSNAKHASCVCSFLLLFEEVVVADARQSTYTGALDADLYGEMIIARNTADAATVGAGIVGSEQLRAVVAHGGLRGGSLN